MCKVEGGKSICIMGYVSSLEKVDLVVTCSYMQVKKCRCGAVSIQVIESISGVQASPILGRGNKLSMI